MEEALNSNNVASDNRDYLQVVLEEPTEPHTFRPDKNHWLTRHAPKIGLLFLAVGVLIGLLVMVLNKGMNVPERGGTPEKNMIRIYNDSTSVYLGNGCFWERQYAYVNIELNCQFNPKPTRAKCTPFNRSTDKLTSVVGYAGGTLGDLACYHHSGDSTDGTLYEDLGHAEAVSVELEAGKEEAQFAALLTDFFDSFNPASAGMERPDPMDAGAPYRSLIGIPGGMNGNLFWLIKQHNIHNMLLQPGNGNEVDVFNTVWVMDSVKFPFHRGEQYHQYHSNFFGPRYPDYYINDLWKLAIAQGTIPPTGCPEGRHS